MKRITLSLLALALVLSFSACGSKQTPQAAAVPETTTVPEETAEALEQAIYSYLDAMNFSRQELIDQLVFDGWTEQEVTDAVDAAAIDWNAQALASAELSGEMSCLSQSGVAETLMNEGFTKEEADYAAENCGADWMANAASSAEGHLSYEQLSREEMIEELKSEGFTPEQAVYGADQNGL